MNAELPVQRRRRGSSLIAVIIFTVIISAAMGSLLEYVTASKRASVRQGMIEQARLVAESEMEYLYYCWQIKARGGIQAKGSNCITDRLYAEGVIGNNALTGGDRTVSVTPLAVNQGWTVNRSLEFPDLPSGRSDGGASGTVPGTSKLGHNFYYQAYTRATITREPFGTVEYRAARRFVQTETSIFQNAIYYQNELETALNGQIVVKGDIVCNEDAYLSSRLDGGMIIWGAARIVGKINGADIDGSGSLGPDLMRDPLTTGGTLYHAAFDPSQSPTPPPESQQQAIRATQVKKLTTPENVIGGVNVTQAAASTPNAYLNPNGDADTNIVYRSIIAPPPRDYTTSPGGPYNLIPENPTVATRRMYNRAGIIITILENPATAGLATDPTHIVVHIGKNTDTTAELLLTNNPVATNNAVVPTSLDATVSSDIDNIVVTTTTPIYGTLFGPRRRPFYDRRERTYANVTTIDIAALKSAIGTSGPLYDAFNGVVYVHDATDLTVSSHNAIRLINGTETPRKNDAISHQPLGFTVVSNNGIYIQGDYNTYITDNTDPLNPKYNPCVIMGDAITALSYGWSDNNRLDTGAATLYARSVTQAGDPRPAWAATDNVTHMTINSALLTGNVATSTYGTTSGGVQNLVRYMENWGDAAGLSGSGGSAVGGQKVTLNGALGELFHSIYFTGQFQNPSVTYPYDVYYNPGTRDLSFDAVLADTPPAFSPSTSSYFRGDFYTW